VLLRHIDTETFVTWQAGMEILIMTIRIHKQAVRLCALFAVALTVRPVLAQSGATFTIDAAQNVQAISPYIYGVNQSITAGSNLTYTRLGGNRWTAYNWTNNYSNAGSDYYYHNDTFLGGGSTPGGAVFPGINNAAANSAGILVTIPMAGYVSAAKTGYTEGGNPSQNPPVYHFVAPSSSSYFVPEFPTQAANTQNLPNAVYENGFVSLLKADYPNDFTAGSTTPINFQLDNEPDLWSSTHQEVHPAATTYAELLQKSIAYATMIKSIVPNSLVYGPVSYGWEGYQTLQNAPDSAVDNAAMDPNTGKPYGSFLSYYLAQMNAAGKTAGTRLLDALDLHWYPEATGINSAGQSTRITANDNSPGVVAARLQAPRSLWDPSYVENSWITNNGQNKTGIDLLPTVQNEINANDPGTKLSISEYNYGGGSYISGGIAEADVLGIFGKYGVYSANEWPLNGSEPFIQGAFAMFRNYNGHGAAFGNTSISANTSDVADTSVYASIDSQDPTHMVVIAINKTANAMTVTINLDHTKTFDLAEIYQLTSASANPVFAGDQTITNPASFTYTMPAYSVSTLNLVDAPEPGVGLVLAIAMVAGALLLGPRIFRRQSQRLII
jgi:hypothetical protein